VFPDPTGIKVSMVDQRVNFSVGVPLNEAMRKLRVVPSYPKDHVQSRFNVKMVYGTRLTANPATRRSNSHSAGFFRAAGRFVHKDARARKGRRFALR
jgi:hypothetical protein